MLRSLRLFWALAPVLVCPLAAQRTWVVDGLMRPGSNFQDLPPAVAAAASGDTIVVRYDGRTYTPFATSKGLTITTDHAQALIVYDAQTQIRVTGLPAGEQFTLRGFLLAGNAARRTMVACSSCQGRVVLHSVECVTATAPILDLQGCRSVALQECRINQGFPPVRASASFVEIVRCQSQAGSADDRVALASAPAVDLFLSVARIEGSSLVGGSGRGVLPPSPALVANNSLVDLGTLGPLSRLIAGSATAAAPSGSPAITGAGSSMRIDGPIPITPSGTAAPIAGVFALPAAFPGLTLDSSQLDAVQLAMRVPAGSPTVLVLGTPMDPVGVPGIAGTLWLEPASLTIAVAPANQFPVPPLPRGLTIGTQLAAVTASGIELSNLGLFVAR